MVFRDQEKERYKALKPELFNKKARQDGNYRGIPRNFCLADDLSEENLFEGIRGPAIEYFKTRKITWHDGIQKRTKPSNHLCCSQSCCVNYLFPMTTRPQLITNVFKPYYPELSEPLPIDADAPLPNGSYPFMAFEWIGVIDYLGETKRKPMIRTRGANFTSADFAFRFRTDNGLIHLVLGEWKYTEEYGRTYKGKGRPGQVRKNNYIDFFMNQKGIFSKNTERQYLYESLFYEPFYQLMRLQLLAQEMELNKGKEMGADIVSVLHICPKANQRFRDTVASEYLVSKFPDEGVLGIWNELVPEGKFMSISVEDLLSTIRQTDIDYQEWVDYLAKRYGWKHQS